MDLDNSVMIMGRDRVSESGRMCKWEMVMTKNTMKKDFFIYLHKRKSVILNTVFI